MATPQRNNNTRGGGNKHIKYKTHQNKTRRHSKPAVHGEGETKALTKTTHNRTATTKHDYDKDKCIKNTHTKAHKRNKTIKRQSNTNNTTTTDNNNTKNKNTTTHKTYNKKRRSNKTAIIHTSKTQTNNNNKNTQQSTHTTKTHQNQ